VADALVKTRQPTRSAPPPAPLLADEAIRERAGASLDIVQVCRIARICAADVMGCDPLALIGKPRGARKLAFARQLAVHLAHVVAGRGHEQVARQFARNRSTASHNFEVLENLRDAPAFDGFLSVLELRYEHMLRIAEQRPRHAWKQAVRELQQMVAEGRLESDAHYDAKFVAETFRDVA